MPIFDSGVNAPSPASYAPQPLNFSQFGQWAADDPYKKIFDRQQQQLNQQRLQQGQKQIDLADAFKDGLPTNPDGSYAYDKMAARIVQLGGDPSVLTQMAPLIQRQQAANTPEWGPGPSGQPAAAPASPDLAAQTSKTIQVEGTGKNPYSSASGVGQFTNGTWIDSIKKYFPNLAQGRTDEQLLAMRQIPQLATRVTEAFTAGNEAGLQKAGLPVTPATTYLAHFAGLGGAIKVLEASPNTPVEKLLSQDAIKANKFLQGMTARDLELWAARKMQGPAMVAQNAQAPQGGAGGTRMTDASSGDLPPSAGGVSPAPQVTRQPPQGGGSPQPPQGQPQQPPLVQPQQQQVQPPAVSNFRAADTALDLNPQEKALYRRHLNNLTGPGGVDNPDGTRSTLKDITVESGGKTYVIPTVYGGKIVSNDEAWNRAKSHLKDFPAYASEAEASARYDAMHGFMNQDTESYQRGQQGGQSAQPQQAQLPPAQTQPAPIQSAPAPIIGTPPRGQAGVPSQPAGPISPKVPLPPGYTDPQEAIRELRRRAAALETRNPNLKPKADDLREWASDIAKSIQPREVHFGTTLLGPDGGVLYQGPGAAAYRGTGGETGQLVRMENAERAERGEQPMTAQEEISFIQGIRPPRSAPAMAVEAFKKDFQHQNGRPPSAEDITKFASNYSREQSYGRTAGGQGARVENAANEVVQLIPQAVEASKNLPRTKWVPWNELVQKWDKGTSDPAYNDFMMANFALMTAYTKAMNPSGVPRVQERLEQHANGILSTATSQQAFEVQVRRLWKEVQASKTATAETAKGVTPGDINAPVPGLDTNRGKTPSGGKTPNGLNWSLE